MKDVYRHRRISLNRALLTIAAHRTVRDIYHDTGSNILSAKDLVRAWTCDYTAPSVARTLSRCAKEIERD